MKQIKNNFVGEIRKNLNGLFHDIFLNVNLNRYREANFTHVCKLALCPSS